MKRVTCLSGLSGFQRRLRTDYSSFEDYKQFAETYNLHSRIGYSTPEAAWKANPLIQSSTNPSDFCRVDSLGRRYQARDEHWGAGELTRIDMLRSLRRSIAA